MSHLLIFGKPIDLPNQGLRNYNFWGLSPCHSARWQLDVQLASSHRYPESPWRVEIIAYCDVEFNVSTSFTILVNSLHICHHLPHTYLLQYIAMT